LCPYVRFFLTAYSHSHCPVIPFFLGNISKKPFKDWDRPELYGMAKLHSRKKEAMK